MNVHKLFCSYKRKWMIVICFVLFQNTVYAGSLILSSSDLKPSPGDTITITVSVVGNIDKPVFLNQFLNGSKFGRTVAAPLEVAPYQWMVTLPQDSSGIRRFEASAKIDGERVISNSIEVIVIPKAISVKSLEFDTNIVDVLYPSQSRQINLIGLFTDGKKYDLTYSKMGTTYSENIVNGTTITAGDSPVISVSADGEILAQQPGEAEVVATNNGKTAVRRINVVAVSADDADGDGLTDAQEDAIGTNKYLPDTDGDGSDDGIEVGSSPAQPLNLNKDGVIDALDKQSVAIKDESGQYVSIHASAGTLFTPYGQKLADYPARSGDLAALNMQRELLNFTVEGLTAGQSVDVTLDFDSLPAGTNKYLKYGYKTVGGVSEWYEFPNFTISGNRITLHLTDNQMGDSNPASGVISEPGGLAGSNIVVNNNPVANDDTATTKQNMLVTTGNVLSNDTDVEGDVLTVSTFDATSAQGGKVANNGNGTFTYTPKADFVGSDSFNYTVSDSKGGTATAKVTITVQATSRGDGSGSSSSGGGSTDLLAVFGLFSLMLLRLFKTKR